jgi:hypothetical protein
MTPEIARRNLDRLVGLIMIGLAFGYLFSGWGAYGWPITGGVVLVLRWLMVVSRRVV